MTVLIGFSLPDMVYEVLRVLAAAFGAVGAYIIVGPVVATLVRLAFKRKLPDSAQTVCRILGAVVVGALIYFYLPLGPGSGTDALRAALGQLHELGLVRRLSSARPLPEHPT